MGRVVAAASLIVATGCSLTLRRAPITAQTKNPSCVSSRPAVDTAAGVSFGIPAVLAATYGVADGDSKALAGGGVLAVASALFFVSAHYGFRDSERCEAELLATRPTQAPLHASEPAPAVALTCEQRRLDMYSRAVTGADPQQRQSLLLSLPSCAEGTDRERAWVLTRMAALDAGAGKCDGIENVAREIYQPDIVLHDVVLMGDIEVKHCLEQARRAL
jgi:hypothetical protein